MKTYRLAIYLLMACWGHVHAQSPDWTKVVYSEPQVRYLMVDIALSNNADSYRKTAQEGDLDSRQAIKWWDAGARIMNLKDFENKWVPNPHGDGGHVRRIVFRGTSRTITGAEVILTRDAEYLQCVMRLTLADLSLGAPLRYYQVRREDPSVDEALRRWEEGVRVTNTNTFAVRIKGNRRSVVYRGTDKPIDGACVQLNSDPAYPECQARYCLADILLGGSVDYYRNTAEKDHETGCLEAVRRYEEGYTIVNLDQFERKELNGHTLITRKGSNERISGLEIRLSSD